MVGIKFDKIKIEKPNTIVIEVLKNSYSNSIMTFYLEFYYNCLIFLNSS